MKLVAATSMCIFTLFSVFSASIAWFEMIRKTGGDADIMPIDKFERFSKISYFDFVGTPTDSACSFNMKPFASITYDLESRTFNKPVDGDGNQINGFNFQMQTYDPMNKHKPVLVLAELVSDVDTSNTTGVQVLAKTETEGFVGAKNTNSLPAYKLGSSNTPNLIIYTDDTNPSDPVDYYPLSSVINFRSKAFSQNEYNSWVNGKTTYDVTLNNTWIEPVAGDSEKPNLKNFVYVDPDADVSQFQQESIVYSSGTGPTVKYIAVVVDYYDAAIEYIYSTYLGDSVLEETYEYLLNFVCDWKWEIG